MRRTTAVFQPDGRRTTIGSHETLLHAAQRCGVGIEDLCGGLGTCGKCKVLIHHGRELLTPPSPPELELKEEDHRRGIRLACQSRPLTAGSLVLEIPPESQRSWQRLQTAGFTPRFRLHPEILRVPIPRRISVPRLRRSGWKIGGDAEVALDTAARRGGRWSLIARQREVLGVARPTEPIWGVAFDIGSTKVAGYLVDLERGTTLQSVAAPNPQMVHGEDIMSRLAFALVSGANEGQLHTELSETLNLLLKRACARAHGRPSWVYAAVAVGNTAMHHFLLGAPVASLARAPYTPAVSQEEWRMARSMGLDAAEGAQVVIPAVVAAFVGSDLVGGVRATGMDRFRGIHALIDVGTNTEICVGGREGLVACSTPSGPAFEGAHIRFGMRAADGAVERVSVAPGSWQVAYRTIGRKKPRGLCGSALLDLLAELRRAGALDEWGRLNDGGSPGAVVTVDHQRSFRVVSALDTAIGHDIVLTQDDVGQLQLAKAAIRAGIELLLDEIHSGPDEIRSFSLAGAFGSYLAPESALRAGMIPPQVPIERIRFVGNTAGSGARLVLMSSSERAAMQRLSRKIRHLPLAGDPRFARLFAGALSLPAFHADLSSRQAGPL